MCAPGRARRAAGAASAYRQARRGTGRAAGNAILDGQRMGTALSALKRGGPSLNVWSTSLFVSSSYLVYVFGF